MSYCSNCGGRLNDKGFCPNCGGMSEANIHPAQQEDSDVLSCLKQSFTDSPLKGVEKAARIRSATIWVTFGSLFIVGFASMSLAAFGTLSPGFFREVCGPRFESVIVNSSGDGGSAMRSFGRLTLHAVIMSILILSILAILTRIAFIHAEEKPSVNQSLNIAAFSLFPLTLAIILTIPAALLWTPFAVLLIVAGISASAVSYYFGIQKASAFRRSPFLTLLLSGIVGAGIFALCSFGLSMLLFQ